MAEKSENKVAERKKGSGYGWRIFCLVLSFGWIGVLCFYHPGRLIWLMLGDVVFVPLAFFALFKLAIIKNGFGLAILRVGELKSFKMRWQGYKFWDPKKDPQDSDNPSEQWDVVSDSEGKSHWFGGLVWVGWFFLNSVHKYTLSWKTISYAGEIKTHEKEELDRFLLLPKSYYFEIEKAEDKNQMPLKINGQAILQMINPKKALFGVDDYLTVVLNTIKGEIVKAVRELSFYKEVEGQKKEVEGQLATAEEKPEEKTTTTATAIVEKEKMIAVIVDKVRENKVIADLLRDYGEQLNSITISNLDPESDLDREATLKPVRARLEAEAVKAKAVGEADAVKVKAKGDAEKIVTLAEANKKAAGLEIGGAHSEIIRALRQENVPEDKMVEMTNEYMKIKMETDKDALRHIKIDTPEGGGGLVGTAAVIAELLKGISGGQQAQQNKSTTEESGGGIIIPKESGSKKETIGGINTPPTEGDEGLPVITEQELGAWLREREQKIEAAKKQGKGKK